MSGISAWLDGLGLGNYAAIFVENAIDLDVLQDLNEADLERMGVALGDRKRILRAAAALSDASSARANGSLPGVAAPQSEAERRHLTVMFCDLVGSTALSERLDPEDLSRVIGSDHACIGEVIRRYQGMIARYMGDGVLAYFGYPQAHEDNVAQGVRAALALVDAVATLRTDGDAALQVRIGIATGTVVVQELLIDETPAEQAVVGETPNLAARLQALAEPGTVLICPNTRRLIGGHFDYRDFGSLALKGRAEPVPVWQVLGTSGVVSRDPRHLRGRAGCIAQSTRRGEGRVG
jgi:class 3 adenylate cyclase